MATDHAIGTRIKKRRQVLHLRQRQLADLVGVDRTAVSNWERGKHLPTRYLGALEDVLGISLDEDDGHARIISPELRRLIAETLSGDTEAQRRVIGLLEGTLVWPEPEPSAPQAESAPGERNRQAD